MKFKVTMPDVEDSSFPIKLFGNTYETDSYQEGATAMAFYVGEQCVAIPTIDKDGNPTFEIIEPDEPKRKPRRAIKIVPSFTTDHGGFGVGCMAVDSLTNEPLSGVQRITVVMEKDAFCKATIEFKGVAIDVDVADSLVNTDYPHDWQEHMLYDGTSPYSIAASKKAAQETDAERYGDLDYEAYQLKDDGRRMDPEWVYPEYVAVKQWQFWSNTDQRIISTPVRVYKMSNGTYALNKADTDELKRLDAEHNPKSKVDDTGSA